MKEIGSIKQMSGVYISYGTNPEPIGDLPDNSTSRDLLEMQWRDQSID